MKHILWQEVSKKDVAKKMNLSEEKIDTFLSAYTSSISIEGNFRPVSISLI